MNNLPPLPLINNHLFIDNSGWVEGMNTCSRYLEYKQLRLRIPSTEKPSLNFGSAMHLVLEYKYVNYGTRQVDDLFYNNASSILTDFFSQHEVPSDDWRNLNHAVSLLREYNKRFPVEEFQLLEYKEPINCPVCGGQGFTLKLKDMGAIKEVTDEKLPCLYCSGTGKRSVMVELPFALELYKHGDITIMYSGRIDLPIHLQNLLYVTDHKNVFTLGQQFTDEQRMSAQHRGYCWAFEQLTGQKVHGYIVNGIRTKDIPLYVRKGKNFSGKEGKITTPGDWWQENFTRDRFILKPGELDEWKSNLIELCEEFFFHYERGHMPMKTKWCTSYGKCGYYQVCSLAPEDRLALLNSGEFTKNVWSPLNQIKTV